MNYRHVHSEGQKLFLLKFYVKVKAHSFLRLCASKQQLREKVSQTFVLSFVELWSGNTLKAEKEKFWEIFGITRCGFHRNGQKWEPSNLWQFGGLPKACLVCKPNVWCQAKPDELVLYTNTHSGIRITKY